MKITRTYKTFGSFLTLKKSYDSVHREILYKITEESETPMKLISLTKLCIENTQYLVIVENTLSKA